MRNINIYIIVIMIVIIIKNIFTPVVEGNTKLINNLLGPLKKKTTTSKNNLGNDVKILSYPLESQLPFTRLKK